MKSTLSTKVAVSSFTGSIAGNLTPEAFNTISPIEFNSKFGIIPDKLFPADTAADASDTRESTSKPASVSDCPKSVFILSSRFEDCAIFLAAAIGSAIPEAKSISKLVKSLN